MCIGIPMRVVEPGTGRSWCEGRGQRELLDTWLVGELPRGTWVLAFRGSAMRVLEDDEARKTNAALDALDAAIAGAQNLDAFFGDLVDRERARS